MYARRVSPLLCTLLVLLTPNLWAEDEIDLTTMRQIDGFVTCYADEESGKLWMLMPRSDQPLLYITSLASGLGSNPVGLDRGQFGESRLVRFRKVGRRVYLIQENVKFRSTSTRRAEQTAVADSFAPSILWSQDLRETSDGRTVADLNSLLIRDAHGCIQSLAATGQGSYSLEKPLSFVEQGRCKAFPRNTELEATLTFKSSKPGRLAGQTAADGKNITLRQHHSFVKLPEAGYQPRNWDPRVGAFQVSYTDYSAPIDGQNEIRLLTRHRLQKVDPNAASSPAKEPIVYYVDSGVPQPVRDALVEGASWWNDAFEAAGFEDAFQVKVLPDEIDPMDVRYNVIQWVHRATRGWSYGQSIVDPRTGEIIKGHVLLGSLRVRQDNRIFRGLSQPTTVAMQPSIHEGICDDVGAGLDAATAMAMQAGFDSVEVALSRIRQLSAHEVGHTLGFAHNFAGSTYADRASVMDYPAPRVRVTGDVLDFSDAYGVGVGSWDRFTVAYAYSQFAKEEEATKLAQLQRNADENGLLYLSDADARPSGAAHPLANLWDNGSDPISGLKEALAVRKVALTRFGKDAVPQGAALADLEQAFAPIYLFHRYQVEAAAKVLGGVLYSYEVNSDRPAKGWTEPPLSQQREALDMLLESIGPKALAVPDTTLPLLLPKAYSSADDRERFPSKVAPGFDETETMRVACDLTLGAILQPQRASRLCLSKHAPWGLSSVLDRIQESLAKNPGGSIRLQTAQSVAWEVYIHRLIALAASPAASLKARATAEARLVSLVQSRMQNPFGPDDRLVGEQLLREVKRFIDRPAESASRMAAPESPPGSPIGARW